MNINKSKSLTLIRFLNVLLIFCLLRVGLVMTAGFSIFSLVLVVLVGGGLIAVCMLLDRSYAGAFFRLNTVALILNIFLIFIVRFIVTNPEHLSTASNYINQLAFLLLLWGFYLYISRLNVKRQRMFVRFYLLLITVSALYTFYVAVNGSPRIIRNTASGVYDSSFPFVYGGYDFIYALVLIYVILLTTLSRAGGRMTTAVKAAVICILVISVITVIISGYSTAFMLILVFTVWSLMKRPATKVGLLVVLAVLIFGVPHLLVDFIKGLPFMPKITSSRVSDLILSISGQGTVEYFSDEGQRWDRLLWSIEVFLENPILGGFLGKTSLPFGYHSEWIEQLARYGLITAISNLAFWVSTYCRMRDQARGSNVTYHCIRNVFFVYLVLGFLNPISMVVTSAPMFVLCPFIECLLIDEKEN